jgi:hypothetical protein
VEENASQEVDEPDTVKNEPHLMNLNEDPLLNGKLRYALTKECTRVGRQNCTPTPDIILQGLGIQTNHADIKNVDGELFIEGSSPDSNEFIFINGEKLTGLT